MKLKCDSVGLCFLCTPLEFVRFRAAEKVERGCAFGERLLDGVADQQRTGAEGLISGIETGEIKIRAVAVVKALHGGNGFGIQAKNAKSQQASGRRPDVVSELRHVHPRIRLICANQRRVNFGDWGTWPMLRRI